jgi:protein-S-isoprenylcysteine O-methyltransferase Ste14
MRVFELKVPPLAVALFVGALMWLATWAIPDLQFTIPARDLLSIGFSCAGIIIIGFGVASFRGARTTVNPMKPALSSALVVSGIYALSRNPMYLGFLLLLIGWAIFLSHPLAFVLVPAFFFYINRFQIEPEEKVLTSLFGDEFLSYTSRVRRWLL